MPGAASFPRLYSLFVYAGVSFTGSDYDVHTAPAIPFLLILFIVSPSR